MSNKVIVSRVAAPALWASYLVNGDASSLNAIELEGANELIDELGRDGKRIVSTDGECYIGRSHGFLCDLVEYIVHEVR